MKLRRIIGGAILGTALVATSLMGTTANAAPTAPLGASVAASGAHFKMKAFHTPSNNIQCAAFKSSGRWSMRCDVLQHDWLVSGTCTEGDYGSSVGMGGKSRARFICVSDAVPTGNVLNYGTRLNYGAFTCKSRHKGLTCKNRRDRGWFLSRETYRLIG